MAEPAGWYRQGENLRYWDGEKWTEHTAPVSAGPPPPARPITALEIVGYVFAVVFPLVGAILACIDALLDRRGRSKHPARILLVAVIVTAVEFSIGFLLGVFSNGV